MRYLSLLALCCLSFPVFSATIDCYTQNRHIYHGVGYGVFFEDTYIGFMDKKGNVIIAYADCIIKLDKRESMEDEQLQDEQPSGA